MNDIKRVFDTHEALYGTISAPADGDDMTWDEIVSDTVILNMDITSRPYFVEHPELLIEQRMTRLETELAELRAKVDAWEADS